MWNRLDLFKILWVPVVILGLGSWGGPVFGQDMTFVINGSCDELQALDLETGGLTSIGNIGFGVNSIAFAPDGRLFSLDVVNDQLVEIDTATGQGTLATALNYNLTSVSGLTYDTAGRLWASGRDAVFDWGFFEIDPVSGATVRRGRLTYQGNPIGGSVALSAAGNTLLTVFADRLMAIDTDSLEIHDLDPLLSVQSGNYMDLTSDNALWVYRPSVPIAPPPPAEIIGYDLVTRDVINAHLNIFICGLAISPPQVVSLPPTDVPTLSGMALLLLATLVSVIALRKLRYGG